MSKILVTYGSRYGSTKEIANHIGETLEKQGHEVEVTRANKSVAVDPYDMVVVGSGIQAGGWHKDASNFLRLNGSTLKWKKIALFVSCGDYMEKAKHEESKQKYLVDVAEKNGLTPVSYGFFGGTFDLTGKKGFLYNMFMKMVKGDLEKKGYNTEGVVDFRNWDEITSWSNALVEHL